MYYRLEDNEKGFLGDFSTLQEIFLMLVEIEEDYFHVSIYKMEGVLNG